MVALPTTGAGRLRPHDGHANGAWSMVHFEFITDSYLVDLPGRSGFLREEGGGFF